MQLFCEHDFDAALAEFVATEVLPAIHDDREIATICAMQRRLDRTPRRSEAWIVRQRELVEAMCKRLCREAVRV